MAQALDYGASLWRHAEFTDLISSLDASASKQWKKTFREKLAEFFALDEEGVAALLEGMRKNLDEGNLKFVVLVDRLEDRLKDLITYINQNSEFDIYAVEVEFYKHQDNEIVIPKIYGAEVKKDLKARTPAKRWTWDLLSTRLREVGQEDVTAAKHILDWAERNEIGIDWSTSQRGGFILCFYTESNKGFYPFGVTGDGKIEWNAPHAANKSPEPFDKRENRAEILRRLQPIGIAKVDLNNVDGYKGLRLPLRALAEKEARDTFFSVCSWIQAALKDRR